MISCLSNWRESATYQHVTQKPLRQSLTRRERCGKFYSMKTQWKTIKVHESTWRSLRIFSLTDGKSIERVIADLIAEKMAQERAKELAVPTE